MSTKCRISCLYNSIRNTTLFIVSKRQLPDAVTQIFVKGLQTTIEADITFKGLQSTGAYLSVLSDLLKYSVLPTSKLTNLWNIFKDILNDTAEYLLTSSQLEKPKISGMSELAGQSFVVLCQILCSIAFTRSELVEIFDFLSAVGSPTKAFLEHSLEFAFDKTKSRGEANHGGSGALNICTVSNTLNGIGHAIPEERKRECLKFLTGYLRLHAMVKFRDIY